MKDLSKGTNAQNFLARIDRDTGAEQLLKEHLLGVSGYTDDSRFFANTSKLIALLHDIGKACQPFQKKLKDNSSEFVKHAHQGVLLISKLIGDNEARFLVRDLVSLVIYGHHNHLPDCLDLSGMKTFWDKLFATEREQKELCFDEVFANCAEVMDNYLQTIANLIEQSHMELEQFGANLPTNTSSNIEKSHAFFWGLLVKYLYSRLVDYDRLDAQFGKNRVQESMPDWRKYINLLEESLKNIAHNNCKQHIFEIRKTISDKCYQAHERPCGIYQLSVPTGGGKTLSTTRFALHHAQKYGKKRIIYVVPFLSIIEQIHDVISKTLKIDDALEFLQDHSNTQPIESNQDTAKLVSERWDAPFVITTMVGFLETLMSARGTVLRKFHNMEDAVIIFDEIQSLPIHSVHLFNEIASFLCSQLRSTIVLCTATQPAIDSTVRKNLMLSEQPLLIEGVNDCFLQLRRTQLVPTEQMKFEEFCQFAHQKSLQTKNCMIILNTKKHVRQLYQYLKQQNPEYPLFHLSTNMCPLHRATVIKEVSALTKAQKKVVLVTSQLVEAGVDISFECVIRAMSGLDSLLQAAGRCNRNGEYGDIMPVFVANISPTDENLSNLREIKYGKDTSLRIFSEYAGEDFYGEEVLNTFYKYYYRTLGNKMDYSIAVGCTAYDCLASNSVAHGLRKNRKGVCTNKFLQSFDYVSKNYHVIEKNTRTVVVDYDKKAGEIIQTFLQAYNPQQKLVALRALQQRSVSLYEQEFNKLVDAGLICSIDQEYNLYQLSRSCYDSCVGYLVHDDGFLSD